MNKRFLIRTGLVLMSSLLACAAEPTNLIQIGNFNFGTNQVGNKVAHTFVWTNANGGFSPIAQAMTSSDSLKIIEAPSGMESNAVQSLSVLLFLTEPGEISVAVSLQVVEPPQSLIFTISGRVENASSEGQVSSSEDHVMIEARELQDLIAASNRPMLVDLRSQAMFVLGHIPGSLNLRMDELRGRAFLRTASVVLIHEGHHNLQLRAATRRLRQQGIRELRILDGGLRAWQAVGGELEGQEPNSSRLFEVPAREMLQTWVDPQWVWVMIEDEVPSNPNPATAASIPVYVRAADLTRFLTAIETQGASPRNILFLDVQGQGYAAMEPALRAANRAWGFYLSGGWEAVREAAVRMETHPGRQVQISSAARERLAARSSRSSSSSGGCCGGKK